MAKKKQSIPNGSVVKIETKGLSEELAEELGMPVKDLLQSLDGTGIVTALATYTSLGEKDYEYYDVEMGNGLILPGISGYHLEIVNHKNK